MSINVKFNTTKTPAAVLDEYSSVDTGFSKTHVPVALAAYGESNLISRSQAKRLLARFECFAEVILDFENVKSIGQGFADEVFRVFALNHPEVHLIPIRANVKVERFIQRAQLAAQLDPRHASAGKSPQLSLPLPSVKDEDE